MKTCKINQNYVSLFLCFTIIASKSFNEIQKKKKKKKRRYVEILFLTREIMREEHPFLWKTEDFSM